MTRSNCGKGSIASIATCTLESWQLSKEAAGITAPEQGVLSKKKMLSQAEMATIKVKVDAANAKKWAHFKGSFYNEKYDSPEVRAKAKERKDKHNKRVADGEVHRDSSYTKATRRF